MTDYVKTSEIDFSQWLSETLTSNKISSSQLAREIDVNRSTVSLWRSGQRLPTCRLKVRIADAIPELVTTQIIQRAKTEDRPFTKAEHRKLHEQREAQKSNSLLREILWRCHVSEWRNHDA